jgi:phosphate:Na+ symporter
MAITLIMLSMGWIPFSAAASMVLGENIGTTITANIAASVGNVNARRAALTHTVFNIIGVIWAIALFKPFLSLVGSIIALLGLPNPAVDGFTVTAEQGGETAALYGISMLHTLFNCINTLLLVWFIPLIIKFVSTAIKDPKVTQAKEVKHLQYINAGMIDTPELAIEEAYKETIHFAKICRKELEYIKSAVESVNGSEFEVYREKLVKYENITDNIEFEVASFLNKLDRASLSESTMMRINALYRIVSELESIGDSGEAISRILSRKGDESKDKLSENSISIVRSFIGIIDRAFEAMINNIENRNQINSIENAIDAEICINRERNDIRSNITRNVSDGSTNYFESIMVLDLVQELERMGDYVINVSESIFESR